LFHVCHGQHGLTLFTIAESGIVSLRGPMILAVKTYCHSVEDGAKL
jgi:hypothetical protein